MDPEEYMSVDEMMIPFKGRSSVKQYLPKKPKKWGYKIWVRAGTSGYVYCFEPYQGASGNRGEISELGVGGDVVMRLCHDIKQQNYKIFADNFFSSIPLVVAAKKENICYLGTIRAQRLQGANDFLIGVKELRRQGRGSSCIVTSEDISIVRWLDNSLVHTISNYAGLEPFEEATRFCRQEKKSIQITRPHAISIYNKHMGGVDLMDCLVALYRNDTKNRRWYMRVFYHFLNVTIVNAWLIWRFNKHENLDLLTFKSQIATSLICKGEGQMKRKEKGRPRSKTPPTPTHVRKPRLHVPKEKRLDNAGHWPQKSEKKNASRCKESKCKRKTRYSCSRCLVALCPECFEDYHK